MVFCVSFVLRPLTPYTAVSISWHCKTRSTKFFKTLSEIYEVEQRYFWSQSAKYSTQLIYINILKSAINEKLFRQASDD